MPKRNLDLSLSSIFLDYKGIRYLYINLEFKLLLFHAFIIFIYYNFVLNASYSFIFLYIYVNYIYIYLNKL